MESHSWGDFAVDVALWDVASGGLASAGGTVGLNGLGGLFHP